MASWGQQFTVANSVPSTTPSTIFDSERWSPSDDPAMQWNFPVASGTHLQVRLYFINQYSGTSGIGQRVFNVAADGNIVLNNYDIVADVGNLVGTMKTFTVTSDGNLNIDFSHVTENPLLNGIEIINTDIPPSPPPGGIHFLGRRTFDGTPGNTSTLNTPNIDWSTTRGIFALQGNLYYGSTDGNFSTRTFNGTSLGPAQQIDLHGLTDFPVQSLTGLFYANGGGSPWTRSRATPRCTTVTSPRRVRSWAPTGSRCRRRSLSHRRHVHPLPREHRGSWGRSGRLRPELGRRRLRRRRRCRLPRQREQPRVVGSAVHG